MIRFFIKWDVLSAETIEPGGSLDSRGRLRDEPFLFAFFLGGIA